MKSRKVVVTIPIYKVHPTSNELLSYLQGITVLKDHVIKIFAPEGLSLDYYLNISDRNDIEVVYFKKEYFVNVMGYNRLMLSKEFYNCFPNFKYILIYQLDAYVFKDDLDYWCSRNYDYIGAPWFEDDENNTPYKFKGVGNGGFSLRKISTMLHVLDNWQKYFTIFSVLKSKYITKYSKIRLTIFYCLKLFNLKLENVSINALFKENEDYIFGLIFSNEIGIISTPKLPEVSNFAFEVNGPYLYDLNNKTLPFGCHGWYKHDTHFWNNFIKTDHKALNENKTTV